MSKDFIDPDNIFSDDYSSDGLYDEQEEEIGIDTHEIDLGNPEIAEQDTERYNEARIVRTANPSHASIKKGKLPAKMKAKGIIKAVFLTKNGSKIILV